MAERNNYFDYVKGILIFLVVLAHGIQYLLYQDKSFFGNVIYKVIYMFHMPLFIAISGYFAYISLNHHSVMKFVVSKIKYILIPLIVWIILNAFMQTGFEESFSFVFFVTKIKNFILSFHIWFLWAIFFYSLLFAFLKFYKLDNKLPVLLMVIVLAILYTRRNSSYIIVSFCPFFVLGYIIPILKLDNVQTKLRKLLPVLAIAFLACFFLWSDNNYVYMNPMGFNNIGYSLFRDVVAIISSILFMYILSFLYERYLGNKVSKILFEVGKNSLGIYLIQDIFFSFVSIYLKEYGMTDIVGILLFVIVTFFVFLLPFFINFLSKRCTIGGWLLFGKR